MQQAKTVSPKTAAQMAAEITKAVESFRIPIIIADQPSLAMMVADTVGISTNKKTDDASVMKALSLAVKEKRESNSTITAVIIKRAKGFAAGQFDGKYFVKIIACRIYINIGSVANLLVSGD